MWPNENVDNDHVLKWKQWHSYYIFITLIPVFLPVFAESIDGLSDSDMTMAEEAQVLLANICIFGMFQLGVCFLRNAEKIKRLVDNLDQFKKYSNLNMLKIDGDAILYSKFFFAYSILGTLIYTFMPFIFVKYCETNKPIRMQKYNIPCGMILPYRLPFPFDKSPIFEIVAIYTAYLASVTTIVIVTITTLVCSIISHVIGHLRELRRHILSIQPGNVPNIKIKVEKIIQYHTAIIEYVNEVNDAFGTQLIAHRTLTSFVISILGFVLITVDNFGEWLRFSMHLFGWLVLIYLVCHYGQTLIDESLGVAVDAYHIEWHTKPVVVQKYIRMIIMRAQKPIVLKALKVETFSANTFVGILKAAYTVFTLLLNVRK
nr:odorant receptor 85b-like [Onthophagus taurus]